MRARAGVLTGILNGADYSQWNPETDPLIRRPAIPPPTLSGKAAGKEQLLREFGLPAEAMNRPLIGMVSRFTRQKGADILAEVAAEIFAEDVYLVALGTGDPEYEEFFRAMAEQISRPRRGADRLRRPPGSPHRGRRRYVPDAQPL